MEKIYEFERAEIDGRLLTVLESLKSLWPGEIDIVDRVAVICGSERARLAVGVLSGESGSPSTAGAQNAPSAQDAKAGPSTTNGSTLSFAQDVELEPKALCQICGEPFEPKQVNSRFCSKVCSQKFHNGKYLEKKRDIEKTGAGPTVIFDQERETQRLVAGVRSGKMELRGRRL